jgi:hypothetical protein
MVGWRGTPGNDLGLKLAPTLPDHHPERGRDGGRDQTERESHHPGRRREDGATVEASLEVERPSREVLAESSLPGKDVPPLDASWRVVIADGAREVITEGEERLGVEAFGSLRRRRGKGELERDILRALREAAAPFVESGQPAELLPVGKARLDVNERSSLALRRERRQDLDSFSFEQGLRTPDPGLLEIVKGGDSVGRTAHPDLARAVDLEEHLLLVLVGGAAGGRQQKQQGGAASHPVILERALEALRQALSDQRGLTHTLPLGLNLHAFHYRFRKVVLGLHRAFAQPPKHLAHDAVQLSLVSRVYADFQLEAIPSRRGPVEIPDPIVTVNLAQFAVDCLLQVSVVFRVDFPHRSPLKIREYGESLPGLVSDRFLIQCLAHLDQKRLSHLSKGIQLVSRAARPYHVDLFPHQDQTVAVGVVLSKILSSLAPHAFSPRFLKSRHLDVPQKEMSQTLFPLSLPYGAEPSPVSVSSGYENFYELREPHPLHVCFSIVLRP